ncbi:MAG: methionine synthase [Deltaproteobacteria bacterium]|nr:methionine synthase [Deltaproteobacteria bacterium]
MGSRPDYYFKTTGIGSVPWIDTDSACARILKRLPDMPFWPQLVNRNPLEYMIAQFTEGLPLIDINKMTGAVTLSSDKREKPLSQFYNHYHADDLEYFSIGPDYARGLYSMIKFEKENPGTEEYVKGHITGPITFAASIKDKDGRSALLYPDLLEAYAEGLAIKALWQVRALEKTGKRSIIFIDEPSLSCFGSELLPIGRHEVTGILKEIIDYLRQRSEAIIGIHCCGNTDWSMIMDSGVDIINFDAFLFQESLFLYPDHLKHFISKGGAIAWGIVPTGDSAGNADIDELYERLVSGLNRLIDLGLTKELVYAASILTPACGMGMMTEKATEDVLDLLSSLSKRMREL